MCCTIDIIEHLVRWAHILNMARRMPWGRALVTALMNKGQSDVEWFSDEQVIHSRAGVGVGVLVLVAAGAEGVVVVVCLLSVSRITA